MIDVKCAVGQRVGLLLKYLSSDCNTILPAGCTSITEVSICIDYIGVYLKVHRVSIYKDYKRNIYI